MRELNVMSFGEERARASWSQASNGAKFPYSCAGSMLTGAAVAVSGRSALLGSLFRM